MVLRNSISNTRKFFQKTIDNFKSLFSNNSTYHKLPKTFNDTSINNHYYHLPKTNNGTTSSSSIQKRFNPKPRDTVRALRQQPRREDRDDTLFSKPKVELVHEKLKEMVKMINDEEHVSDVREFLYCYSRLRYTAYLDVVEHFFMEVYSDFLCPQPLELTIVGSYGGHEQ